MTAPAKWAPPSSVGAVHPRISEAKEILDNYRYGAALKAEKTANDGKYTDVYTPEFGAALKGYAPAVNEQIRKGQRRPPYVTVGGVFDWTVQDQMGFLAPPAPPPPAWRPIYFISAPGSGANNLVGPSSDVGNLVSDGWGRPNTALHLNHWRLNFPIGGYLGLMGGDPGLSYIEVIEAEGRDLEVQVGLAIADVRAHGLDPLTTIEFWFSGYSQSADGMKRAVVRLFGPGGPFAEYRARINGLILFGDPSRAPGPVKRGAGREGYNPRGWGIARYDSPQWVDDLTYSITTDGDMYACAEDDTLLPGFYQWFVRAELEMSFIMFSAGIVIPAIVSNLGVFGGLLGPFAGLATTLMAQQSGVSLPFLKDIIGTGVATDPVLDEFRADLNNILSIGGITKLFKTLAALPGVQTHGAYFEPRAEFGGRTGVQVGYDIIAGFRRP